MLKDEDWTRLEEAGLSQDTLPGHADPWIFCCSVQDSPGKVLSVVLDGAQLATVQPASAAQRFAENRIGISSVRKLSSKVRPKGYFLGSRSFLGFCGRGFVIFPLVDVSGHSVATRRGEGSFTFTLHIQHEKELSIRIRALDSGFLARSVRVAGILGGNPDVDKVVKPKYELVDLFDAFGRVLHR